MRTQASYLIIGRITRPHGVRGEVKVRPETDFPERFAPLRRVLLVREAREGLVRTVEVESVRRQGDLVLLKIAGTDDLEAARALAGAALAVPWEDRVGLPAGAYYVAEIVGLSVRTIAGDALGTVAEVIRTPAHDIYRVEGTDGEVLIPATREVVRAVDLDRGEMVVALPEGLR